MQIDPDNGRAPPRDSGIHGAALVPRDPSTLTFVFGGLTLSHAANLASTPHRTPK